MGIANEAESSRRLRRATASPNDTSDAELITTPSLNRSTAIPKNISHGKPSCCAPPNLVFRMPIAWSVGREESAIGHAVVDAAEARTRVNLCCALPAVRCSMHG